MDNAPVTTSDPSVVPFPSSTRRFDAAVIGGGIVGLATAMALAREHRLSVIVLEAEARLAAHQTGNNSGVIHSGLYYKPGSLKARLCTSGRDEMYRFCAEHGVTHERCGKVVVAIDESELPALDTLHQRGAANGLQDVRRLSIQEVREHEPHVAGVAGLFVADTGIVNYKQVTAAYAQVVRRHDGHVHASARVLRVTLNPDAIVLHTTQGDVEALNLEGLYSVTRLVRQLVDELAGRPERLAFDPRQFEPRDIDEPVADEVGRPPLKIGVVPGPEDGLPGVPVDALVEASPGARAGIRVGDRIVRVGAYSVESVYEYVRALREVPPDASWRMVVERDGSRVTLTIEPAEAPQ